MARTPVTVQGLPRQGRVNRSPQHPFYIYARPFEITPFFIAPVLPGETMRNLKVQSRVVTDPIANPLIGWWHEMYFFYVKHSDINHSQGVEDFTAMHLDIDHDLSAHDVESADDAWHYTAIGGIKYVEYCLKAVVDNYFRDEGEVAADHVISTGRPAAKIHGESWTDSLIPASDLQSVDIELLDISAGTTVEGGDDKLMMSELDNARRTYEFMRQHGITDLDYEDYLATFGISVPKAELHIPELVRFIREWTYPTNTIDPTSGAPRSACSWAITERADKDRFFREPGFLFGVQLTRPKVYRGEQDGALAAHLDNALSWLPAIMSDDPATSLKPFGNTAGPIAARASVDYVVDMRDLFVFGDQFVNVDLDTAYASGLDINRVALPSADVTNQLYPSGTDADALFVAVENGTAGLTKYRVRSDGIVSVTIAGKQWDTTPRGGQLTI